MSFFGTMKIDFVFFLVIIKVYRNCIRYPLSPFTEKAALLLFLNNSFASSVVISFLIFLTFLNIS